MMGLFAHLIEFIRPWDGIKCRIYMEERAFERQRSGVLVLPIMWLGMALACLGCPNLY